MLADEDGLSLNFRITARQAAEYAKAVALLNSSRPRP